MKIFRRFIQGFIQTFFGTALALLILAHPGQAAQKNSPEFKEAAYYGGPGDQRSPGYGKGIAVQGKQLFLIGLDFTHSYELGAQSLVVRYDLPLGSSQPEAFKWPNQSTAGSPMRGLGLPEAFFSVVTTSEGLYLAGTSWTQTHGEDPKKLSKGVLVKFPLNGPTGPGVGGSLWVAKSDFFKNKGWEAYLAVAADTEEDSAFLYTTGFAHWHEMGTGNNTAVLAKYDTQGNLIWSKVLGRTDPWTESAGQAVVVMDGHVYVSGYTRYPTYGGNTLRAVIWKLDSAGNLVWTKTCEEEPLADVKKRNYPLGPVVVTASGGHLFLAITRRDAEFVADILLLKYDQKGKLLWKQRWGSVKDDVVRGITSHRNRIYLVGETAGSVGGEKDAFLVEMDAKNGEVISPDFRGGEFEDKAWGVVASGKDLYVAGETETRSFLGRGISRQNDLMVLHYTLTSSPPDSEHPRKGSVIRKPGEPPPHPKGTTPEQPLKSKQTQQPQKELGVIH